MGQSGRDPAYLHYLQHQSGRHDPDRTGPAGAYTVDRRFGPQGGAARTRSGQEIVCSHGSKRGILVDRETSVLTSKLRAHEITRRHQGKEPDTFRFMEPTGKILGVFPKKLQ
jgi:hypothetical protein